MSTSNEGSIAPVDLIFSGEFEIEAPVDETWPHALNYAKWQNFPIVEHVSGPTGAPGEIVKLKKETDGYTIGPYLARTLKLDHDNHVVVWKVYLDPDQGAIEGLGGAANVQGNVEFRLRETDSGRTLFEYNLIYEYMVRYSDPAELDAFRERQFHDWNTVFETNWPKLKALAETGGAAHG